MLSYKKPLIDKLVEPLITPLKHVHPNALTLLGSIPSILFFVFMLNHWYLWALIAFLGTTFDALDGMVARKYNKVTKFGGVLDSTFDRLSDFLLITSFAFAGITSWPITMLVLLMTFLVSYTRTRSEASDHTISFAIGLIERTERLAIILIGLILYILFPQFILLKRNIMGIAFLVLFVLSLYTFIQRLIFAHKKLG